jgi:hypothetical protein
MKIKLHDRVKLDDGRTGSIVYDLKETGLPFLCLLDNGPGVSVWLSRDDERVTEIIGHRYFVDTPFTIGETYETYFSNAKVIGVGLIVENEVGRMEARNADGTDVNNSDALNLTFPAKPEPSWDGKTVEIDGKKYRLSLVEE